jgi:hypothetical protein
VPRQVIKILTKGRPLGESTTREYRITYRDDAPERAAAIEFFRNRFGISCLIAVDEWLWALFDEMPPEDAQRYLDEHPRQEFWKVLLLTGNRDCTDEELRRLEFFPELEWLVLNSRYVTDEGIRCLRWLPDLTDLVIYSPLVTDGCLGEIARHVHLKSLDMQRSSQVSSMGYRNLVESLPKLTQSYPPRALSHQHDFHRP